jgi:hypothetical protein
MLYSNWTRNKSLLECHISKTTVRNLDYHSGGQDNFKGKTITLLSYTQTDVSTKVILTFSDYDAVYTFWYLSFGKKISDSIIGDMQKEP